MTLPTAETNNWLLLIEDRLEKQTSEDHTSSAYRLLGPVLLRKRRLAEVQAIEMAVRCERSSMAYELAAEFGHKHTTVVARLKKGWNRDALATDAVVRADTWSSVNYNLSRARDVFYEPN